MRSERAAERARRKAELAAGRAHKAEKLAAVRARRAQPRAKRAVARAERAFKVFLMSQVPQHLVQSQPTGPSRSGQLRTASAHRQASVVRDLTVSRSLLD